MRYSIIILVLLVVLLSVSPAARNSHCSVAHNNPSAARAHHASLSSCLLSPSSCLLTPTVPVHAPSFEADSIRIMTFNIRYGTAPDGEQSWWNRRDCLFGVVRDTRPDILCLQEALRGQLDEIRAAFPEYAEAGVGRDDGKTEGEYAAILFRSARFEKRVDSTFWFSDTPDVPASKHWGNGIPRICTFVLLHDEQSDNDITVYNVHLDHESQPSREKSAAALLARIARRGSAAHVLVAGDFNAGPANAAVTSMLAAHVSGTADPLLYDMYASLHPGETSGTYHAYSGKERSQRIDLLLASPHIRAHAAQIIRSSCGMLWPSDHFPVLAICTLGP